METSHKKKHPDVSLVEYVHDFYLGSSKTGDGHYVMNLIKPFVELISTWTKKCADNYKTWQFLLIYHYGSLIDIVYRMCDIVSYTEFSSVVGYFFFQTHLNLIQTIYVLEMTTIYSQSIIKFRMGIR